MVFNPKYRGAPGYNSWMPLDGELVLERYTVVNRSLFIQCKENGWRRRQITLYGRCVFRPIGVDCVFVIEDISRLIPKG